MKRAGWTKTVSGRHGGCGARWGYSDGWAVQHCGHPTANYPWYGEDPHGHMILHPTNGRAFRFLRDAMAAVEAAEAQLANRKQQK